MDWAKEPLKQLASQLVKRYSTRQKELDAIADVFGDPTVLKKYYIDPFLQNTNPTDLDEIDDDTTISKECAFDAVEHLIKHASTQANGSEPLIIQSDAGMGKSSFLLMVKVKELYRFRPVGYNCKLIKIDSNTIAKIESIENKRDTVLLLDALDEDSSAAQNIEGRVIELLSASEHFRQVIITCRTQYFPEGKPGAFGGREKLVFGGYNCHVRFLSPFDDDRLREYIDKKYRSPWFSFSNDAAEKRKEARLMLQRMNSLRFRPFLASHIDDLITAKKRELGDEADIYDALIEVWLDREIAKQSHQMDTSRPNLSSDLRDACRSIAVEMFLAGQQNVTSEQVQEMATKDPRIGYLEKFDFKGRSLLNRDSEQKFRFSHKSVQEFLIAESLALGYKSKEILRHQRISDVVEDFYWKIHLSPRSRRNRNNLPWPLLCCQFNADSDNIGRSVGEINRMLVGVRDAPTAIIGTCDSKNTVRFPPNSSEILTAESKFFLYIGSKKDNDLHDLYHIQQVDCPVKDPRLKRTSLKHKGAKTDSDKALYYALIHHDRRSSSTASPERNPEILSFIQDEYYLKPRDLTSQDKY